MRLGKYAVLACLLMAMGFAATQVLAAVPQVYLKFEGASPWADSSGNGFNATPVGDAIITPDSKVGLGACLLSGNGYLSIANPANLTLGQANYSVAFWFKTPTGTQATTGFWAKDASGATAAGVKIFGLNNTSNYGKLAWDQNSPAAVYGTRTTNNDGLWHHVILTSRSRNQQPSGASETIRIYLDGGPLHTTTPPSPTGVQDLNSSQTTVLDSGIVAAPAVFSIGRASTGSASATNNFVGWIDNFKFFNVCLSTQDANQEYRCNTSGVGTITVGVSGTGMVLNSQTAVTFPTINPVTTPAGFTGTITIKNNNTLNSGTLEFLRQGTVAAEPYQGMVLSGAAAARYSITSVTPIGWNHPDRGLAGQGTLSINVKFTPLVTDYIAPADSTQRATLTLYTNINGTPAYAITLQGGVVPVGMSSFSAK